MATVIALEDIKSSPTAACFLGRDHGEPGVSFFVTRTPPGAPHGFTNRTQDLLLQVNIHPRDEMETTWLDE